jgi:hypothetical protein
MKLVMAEKRKHKGITLKQAMKLAKKKYHKKGGAEGEEPEPEMEDVGMSMPPAAEGARRRKTRKGGSKLSPLPIGGRRRKTAKKTRKGGNWKY